MRGKIFGYCLILIGCLAFTSCQTDVVYSQFHPISSEQWHADSIVRFDYTIEDTTLDYRILLYVRHTERYPYQNMWLFVDNGEMVDSIEFYLADDRGQWLGDKHNGIIEMAVLMEESKHFSDTGTYYMKVQHGMRDTLLRGVSDVGLEIVRNN